MNIPSTDPVYLHSTNSTFPTLSSELISAPTFYHTQAYWYETTDDARHNITFPNIHVPHPRTTCWWSLAQRTFGYPPPVPGHFQTWIQHGKTLLYETQALRDSRQFRRACETEMSHQVYGWGLTVIHLHHLLPFLHWHSFVDNICSPAR